MPDKSGLARVAEGRMEKEQLGTRVDPPLGQRLRVYAAVNRRTVAEVVGAALDNYLPSLTDLVRNAGSEPDDAVGRIPDTTLADSWAEITGDGVF